MAMALSLLSCLCITGPFIFKEATVEDPAVILMVIKPSSLYLRSRNQEALHWVDFFFCKLIYYKRTLLSKVPTRTSELTKRIDDASPHIFLVKRAW